MPNFFWHTIVIFDTVSQFLKYGLLLMILFCYLTSAVELDVKESKQNYEKENHSFICSTSDTYQFSHLEVAAVLPAFILSYWFGEQVLQQTYTRLSATELHPPERLYLRYSVFIIWFFDFHFVLFQTSERSKLSCILFKSKFQLNGNSFSTSISLCRACCNSCTYC